MTLAPRRGGCAPACGRCPHPCGDARPHPCARAHAGEIVGTMATTAAGPPEAANDTAWHVLSRDDALHELHVEPARGLTNRGCRRAARALRAEPVRRGEDGVAPARVPAPVRGPDADRAARGRDHLALPGQAVRHRHRDPAADAAQCGARAQPGGQGRGGRRRAGEDDDRQGAGAPRRRAGARAGRAARARRRRRDRGRRRRPGRRPRAGGRDAGGRRGGADR